MVTGVVGGRSIREMREAEILLHRCEGVEQLFLAVEATVRVVAGIGIELDLAGRNLDQPCTQGAGQVTSFLLLGFWVRRLASKRRNRALAQIDASTRQQQR